MTPERLREACAAAGLDCGPDGCFPEVDNTGDYTGPFMEWSNPALLPYVASVLWKQCVEQTLEVAMQEALRGMRMPLIYATPEHIATAAMVALGKWTLEQAREAIKS